MTKGQGMSDTEIADPAWTADSAWACGQLGSLLWLRTQLRDVAERWERAPDGLPVAQWMHVLADDCDREWDRAIAAMGKYRDSLLGKASDIGIAQRAALAKALRKCEVIATEAVVNAKTRLRDAAEQWEKTPGGLPVSQSLSMIRDGISREFLRAGTLPDEERYSLLGKALGKADKPLTTTERNTLLTIIAALCKHLKIDTGAHGAAVEIARLTELISAPVSDDTVLRHLKKIPDALESRMK